MKYIISMLLLLVFQPLKAEPFYELLKKYASGFLAVSDEIKILADSVNNRYSETYFIMIPDNEKILDVLNKSEIKDTLIYNSKVLIRKEGYNENELIRKYNYDTLYLLIDEIKRMIKTSIPNIDLCMKTAVVKENFLNSKLFDEEIKGYESYQNLMVEIASVIKNNKDTLFLPQYDTLNDASNLFYWTEWHKTTLEVQDSETAKSLKKFDTRYGQNSDKINVLELLIINTMHPFKGNSKGPSSWEPIVRLSPICYNFTDEKYIKTAQFGMNYYFLEKPFLNIVHHIGFAFAIAMNSQHIYDLTWPSFGIITHLSKYQIGIIRDKTTGSLKFISTIDFQIIPKVF